MDLINLRTLSFYHWLFVCYLLFHLPLNHALSFKFPDFKQDGRLKLNGTASIQNGILALTSYSTDNTAAGRATYFEDMQLFDPITGKSTDFTTHFSFKISTINSSGQDGLTFFLAPNGSHLPNDAAGGCLALISKCDNFTIPRKELVDVEFDTYNNTWDETDSEHVGININSIKSAVSTDLSRSMKNASRIDVRISYDSKKNNLSVSWTFPDSPFLRGNTNLSHTINLTAFLPEWVSIGFSAGSAFYFEMHDILSWELETNFSSEGSQRGLIIGSVIGGFFSACGIVLILVFVWRRSREKAKDGVNNGDSSMEREIEHGTGPKRFSYDELVRATNNFAEDGKLGEGGFGGVYKGFLSDLHEFVAVKKVSKRSNQGKKEYISEVKIISRLTHKNLVQLIGFGAMNLVISFLSMSSCLMVALIFTFLEKKQCLTGQQGIK